MIEKILQSLSRELFWDKQFTRPPFKGLSAEIHFNTGRGEYFSTYQKVAERLFVLKTVHVEALVVAPT